MKQIKKMDSSCYYLFTGGSTARDLFFEEEKDIEEYLELLERMLSGYLKVQSFLLYKDQWMLAVKLGTKEEIMKKYLEDRSKSKKADRTKDHVEIWRIISERMRLFLCNYVAKSNLRKGRKGCKVDSSYQRYYFSTKKEMEEEINRWERRDISTRQKNDRYIYLEEHYKVKEREQGMQMLIFCGKEEKGEFLGRYTNEIWSMMGESIDVVGQWITTTLKHHQPPDI